MNSFWEQCELPSVGCTLGTTVVLATLRCNCQPEVWFLTPGDWLQQWRRAASWPQPRGGHLLEGKALPSFDPALGLGFRLIPSHVRLTGHANA